MAVVAGAGVARAGVARAGVVTNPAAVLHDRLSRLELGESQPEIYDRPVGLRMLYQDPGSGAEHYLVRYPPGLRARHHRHSAAHTIIVLDGEMEANGQLLHAGSYAHFAAGAVMHHAPADGEHCLFVIIFDGPFDVTAVDDVLPSTSG
jgi:quercetin dioxygenase-like cupin family protein